MKYVKEEYMDKDGEKGLVFIERFLGKKEQCVLSTARRFISPIVENIEYDEENNVFLVRDEYHDVYPDGRVGTNKANVYFYLDFEGNPIGLAYTDAFDGMFTPVLKSEDNPFHDRWFLAYGEFKRDLGLKFGESITRRKNHYGECAKKMLSAYKK